MEVNMLVCYIYFNNNVYKHKNYKYSIIYWKIRLINLFLSYYAKSNFRIDFFKNESCIKKNFFRLFLEELSYI